MSEGNHSIGSIIGMARTISSSGQIGMKQSKIEAELTVAQLIGGESLAFLDRHSCNYWSYLKNVLNEYVATRQLDAEFVVKGSPFNWHNAVGTKCSAVLLRRGFHKGDSHVEPELYLEVGLLLDRHRNIVPGAACGFHYLPSSEGDASPFVRGVLGDDDLRSRAWALSNNGFVNPAFQASAPASFWTMDAALFKLWPEDRLPANLKDEVFEVFDELLPFYRRIIAL